MYSRDTHADISLVSSRLVFTCVCAFQCCWWCQEQLCFCLWNIHAGRESAGIHSHPLRPQIESQTSANSSTLKENSSILGSSHIYFVTKCLQFPALPRFPSNPKYAANLLTTPRTETLCVDLSQRKRLESVSVWGKRKTRLCVPSYDDRETEPPTVFLPVWLSSVSWTEAFLLANGSKSRIRKSKPPFCILSTQERLTSTTAIKVH